MSCQCGLDSEIYLLLFPDLAMLYPLVVAVAKVSVRLLSDRDCTCCHMQGSVVLDLQRPAGMSASAAAGRKPDLVTLT